MNQKERLEYLITYLKNEDEHYKNTKIPSTQKDQEYMLRSMMNMRMPRPISDEFLAIQDAYLQEKLNQSGYTDFNDLSPIQPQLYLWQGDIKRLKVDAIVNAANNRLLGCFIPNHRCIDNAIHTFAGIQLRLECHKIMEKQAFPEPIGKAKITSGYNLPAKYVIHTVGPMIIKTLQQRHCDQLKLCYQSCLQLADKHHLKSIAFCCISTGEFHFPNDVAAKIAIETTTEYLKETNSTLQVVFNVFKDKDYELYKQLLTSPSNA